MQDRSQRLFLTENNVCRLVLLQRYKYKLLIVIFFQFYNFTCVAIFVLETSRWRSRAKVTGKIFGLDRIIVPGIVLRYNRLLAAILNNLHLIIT